MESQHTAVQQPTPSRWFQALDLAAMFKSGGFRLSLKNAAFGICEYLSQPVFMFIATPFLVARLGLEQFGLWMLVSALSGTVGVLNLGVGDATIKYVSFFRGQKNEARMVRAINASLMLSLLLGGASAVAVYASAPLLALHVFKVSLSNQPLAVASIRAGSFILFVKSIDGVLASGLRAFERYALSSSAAMTVRLLTTVCAIILTAAGKNVFVILVATAGATILGLLMQAVALKRLVRSLRIRLTVDREAMSEICGFGIYSWIQGVAGVLFMHADRLVIAALLSTSALTYYTVCLQLTQPIHGVIWAAFGFLFPYISARQHSTSNAAIRRVYRLSLAVGLSAAMVFTMILLAFGN